MASIEIIWSVAAEPDSLYKYKTFQFWLGGKGFA